MTCHEGFPIKSLSFFLTDLSLQEAIGLERLLKFLNPLTFIDFVRKK